MRVVRPVDLPLDAGGAEIQAIEFGYQRCADQDAFARERRPVRHAVVVVGAGPVGLSAAIDLAQRGQRVLLLDNDGRLSTGSRAICFAKRTLEIWDRLGVGQRVVDKGVGWSVGKVFFGDDHVYTFDLLPEPGHERPAFVNLPQYYAEAYLVARAAALPNVELRFHHEVVAVDARDEAVVLGVDTPDGRYDVACDWVVACDGARSSLRRMMGLETQGRVFRDRFLIADVKMAADSLATGHPEAGASPLGGQRSGQAASVGAGGFPAQRWFWFDPPLHRNHSVGKAKSKPSSVLLHRQPDDVWRIDFQLGWDADADEEKKPERIVPRVQALFGTAARGQRDGSPSPARSFQLEWASVYTFACERMPHFRHGRVLFAGDAAHRVSPFGARGANSGVQDADNLAWKLARVLRGASPAALLDSYAFERELAADENIRHSTRSTDFITPKSEVSRLFRDAVLDLAREHDFARRLVNSGRLSLPTTYDGSPLNTPDADADWAGAPRPGAPAVDAPLVIDGRRTWLLRELGADFTLLAWHGAPRCCVGLPLKVLALAPTHDAEGWLASRYTLKPGSAYLLRPDGHVAARWRAPTTAAVEDAIARATATL